MSQQPKCFLDLRDVPEAELKQMIAHAKQLKSERGKHSMPFAGKTLAMMFEKPSTRTRVSFELAAVELGGHVMSLDANQLQLGRGETIADTARVMSRYVDAIMLRANSHEKLLELAQYADVPIINGLTDVCHPCQVMADMLTIVEKLGSTEGKTVAWLGDGNNMANTLISAAGAFGFTLKLACPKELQPSKAFLDFAAGQHANVEFCDKAEQAAEGADVVMTDTWVSMGDADVERRMELLGPYQVNSELMQLAKSDAIFMHCLPAHRGQEVTDEVMDSQQSAVWDQAENRLHVQKAILLWCLGEGNLNEQ